MKKVVVSIILFFALYEGAFATPSFMGTDWGTGSSVFHMPDSQKMQDVSFGLKFGDVFLLIMSFGLMFSILGLGSGLRQDEIVRNNRKQKQTSTEKYPSANK